MDNQSFSQPPVGGEPQGGAGMAIASMVLGIVALLLSCCVPYVPFVCAFLGVVLGGVALGKKTAGKGMAIAGLVCSIIAFIPTILVALGIAGGLAGLGSLSI